MSNAKMDMKQMLLDAFNMERKAQDMYDMVWNELNKSQRQNIQKTLIGIIFIGDEDTFKQVNDQYREDKSKLLPKVLKDIQCFHRTAMAFSRRQKKEVEQIEQVDEMLSIITNAVAGTTSGATTNGVSSTDSGEKKQRGQGRPAKQDNPEHLIQKAIALITRDDVKVLLQQALIQMKLGLTQHANLNQTFITPFEEQETGTINVTTSDSDVWW